MLMISRKVDEEIVLPEQNIVIKLLRVRGGRIVLGIAAPRDASILRRSPCREEVVSKHLPRSK
jgi:carbon storage regulator